MSIYHLSETEAYDLESCNRQIDLVVDLCGQVPDSKRHAVPMDGLMHFLESINKTLGNIHSNVITRYEAEIALGQKGVNLNPTVLMFALRIASGRRQSTPPGVESKIKEALELLSQVDEAWELVAREWALVEQQLPPDEAGEANASAARNREHLTAGA